MCVGVFYLFLYPSSRRWFVQAVSVILGDVQRIQHQLHQGLQVSAAASALGEGEGFQHLILRDSDTSSNQSIHIFMQQWDFFGFYVRWLPLN